MAGEKLTPAHVKTDWHRHVLNHEDDTVLKREAVLAASFVDGPAADSIKAIVNRVRSLERAGSIIADRILEYHQYQRQLPNDLVAYAEALRDLVQMADAGRSALEDSSHE